MKIQIRTLSSMTQNPWRVKVFSILFQPFTLFCKLFFSISKHNLFSYFLHFTKRKPLKDYGKFLIFHQIYYFWSTFEDLKRKLETEVMTYEVLHKLPIVFLINSKSVWIRASEMANWQMTKERKLLDTLGTQKRDW